MEFTDFLTSEIGRPKENTIGEKDIVVLFVGRKSISFMYMKRQGNIYVLNVNV